MKLDFTAIRGTTADKPMNSPVVTFERLKGIEMPIEVKTSKNGKNQPSDGAGRLVSAYQKEQADHERILQVCKDYQHNTREAEGLTTAILKGARAGEPPVTLLLKAVKCIGLMTGETVTYSQLEEDIKSVYGVGLLEPEPLRMELEEVKGRLQKLQNALERDTEPEDSKKRIQAAIESHKARANQLEKLLQRETQP